MGQRGGKRCIHCDKTAAFGSSVCYRHGAAGQLASPIIQRARMRALSLEQLEEIIRDPRRAGGRRPSHSSNKWFTADVVELHRVLASAEVFRRQDNDPVLAVQRVVKELKDERMRADLEELL